MKVCRHLFVLLLLVACSVGVRAQAPGAVELGTINFPTSAKPAAQGPFLVGVKGLYNFEFDIAAEAFREAQKADPGFALGYWGEAMSYNHPLWAQQDLSAARKALERLAPTAAARAYSKIAPSAAHALHMPSHIFVQLGMWDDVIASNIVAYKAAVDLAAAKNLPRGREDFHTLSWLQYAYLQEGKIDEAQKCVDQAKAVADKDTAPNIRDGYASMKARQVVESAKWEKLALSSGPVRDGGAPGYDGSASYVLAAGLSAAKLGDTATAAAAVEKLKAMRTQAESGSNAYRSKPFAIMEKEVAAALAIAQKDTATAEKLLKEATAIELTLDAPSGPAEPIQPSFELYGDLLIELHRPAEAAAQFQQALQRMPNRRASLRGLERASGQRSTTVLQ